MRLVHPQEFLSYNGHELHPPAFWLLQSPPQPQPQSLWVSLRRNVTTRNATAAATINPVMIT
ncbi:MAG: hypothetical protein IKX51_06620 [Bacteroidales bacterium]|nr:hypothetical protein [Bacteroidales bacterium]